MEATGLSGQPLENPLPDAEVLRRNADSIRRLEKRLIGDVIEVGRLLSDSKCRLRHGEWLPWLEGEFSWSERTARNFVTAYEFVQSKSVNVADLRIDFSSLYLLAAPSTPEEARDEVMGRLKAGESLSRAEIKGVVDEIKKPEARAHRSLSHISVHEAVDRSIYASLRKLLPFEREKLMRRARKDLHGALDEAEMKGRLQKGYRHLLHAIEETDAVAKWPVKKIIEAVPAEQRPALVELLKRTIRLYQKFLAKLVPNQNSDQTPSHNDKETLNQLFKEARKNSKKTFGYIDHAQIVQTMWHSLNPAQISLVLDGKLGETIRIAAERFNRQQTDGQRGR